MVDKLKTILTEIKKAKGSVNLFAIIKMDEITDKWSLILSAPWITSSNTTEIFNYMRLLLLSRLSEEEKATIARIGIFTNDEKLVRLLTSSFKIENSDVYITDTKINGFTINEAYIFESILPSITP